MNWLLYFLKAFGFVIPVVIIYNILNIYILSKYKPNKWIIFALLIVMLTGGQYIGRSGLDSTILRLCIAGIFTILFLWFIDLFKSDRYEMKNKEKDIEIRPKAKPNRVKHKNKYNN